LISFQEKKRGGRERERRKRSKEIEREEGREEIRRKWDSSLGSNKGLPCLSI